VTATKAVKFSAKLATGQLLTGDLDPDAGTAAPATGPHAAPAAAAATTATGPVASTPAEA
jgi:hypothetical protein